MLKVSRILHAGYIFEHEGVSLAFDPIFENPFSRNCYAFPPVEFELAGLRATHFDAVFISHFHDDHCSLESLALLDRATPIYIFCVFDEMLALIGELGFKHVTALRLGESMSVGAFEVTAHRALDENVDSIFDLRVAGLKILNVVDSWIGPQTMEQLSAQAPWDLVLFPFQTMREIEVIAPSVAEAAPRTLPPEWIAQIKELRPRFVVPSSCQFQLEPWSWYNQAFFPITYAQFRKEIEAAGSQVVRLNPGISIEIDQGGLRPAGRLPWIKPIGEQDVDYRFNPPDEPPSTGEIARYFSALSAADLRLIHDFCEAGILEKHNSLGAAPNDYWRKPRIWKLSLYDHHGQVTDFFYRLHDDDMQVIEDAAHGYDWATEVPAAKIHAALELGESLTSMYIRVTPPAGVDIDIVEDPLLRCLFNGNFATYQKAQLKRLRDTGTWYGERMKRVLYESGKVIGEVEDWHQVLGEAVYKTFLGKTALVAPAKIECTFTSPKPVKWRGKFTIVEDGKNEFALEIVKIVGGTQIIAKYLQPKT